MKEITRTTPQGLLASNVAEKLKEVKASLFVFQAKSFMTSSSNRFQQDGLSWVKSVIPDDEELEMKEPGVIGVTHSSDELLKQREAKLIYPTGASGQAADPAVLVKTITNDLEKWLFAVLRKIDYLNSVLTGDITDMTEKQLAIAAKAMAIETGLSIDECIRLLTAGGDKAYVRHCSIEKPEEPNLDVMKPYVFISFTDYDNISRSFTDLVVKGTSGILPEKKEALQRMCESLITAQISEEELPKYLKKTMNDIWLEFFQVNFNIPQLRDIVIEDIVTAPDNGFSEAYNALVRAATNWSSLDIQQYEWVMAGAGNESFYWVPASKFPGFANE